MAGRGRGKQAAPPDTRSSPTKSQQKPANSGRSAGDNAAAKAVPAAAAPAPASAAPAENKPVKVDKAEPEPAVRYCIFQLNSNDLED